MRISTVIPLHNGGATILGALDSVLNQTFKPVEIVVVNDGSTDDSEHKISELKDPLIKIVRQENAGVSAARNRGISESSGEWIAFLDADDVWLPDHLMDFRSLSEKYPLCQVLAGTYIMQDYKGYQEKINLNKIRFSDEYGELNNYFEVASCSHPPIHSSSVAVKKSAILAVGGFPAGVQSGEDLLTWAKLAVNYRIAYTLQPVGIFVMDPAHSYDRKPNRIPQTPDIVGNELAKLAKRNNTIPGIKDYTAHWFKMRSSIFLRLGMKKQAINEVFKSLSFNPFNPRVYFYIILLILPISLINLIFKKLRAL